MDSFVSVLVLPGQSSLVRKSLAGPLFNCGPLERSWLIYWKRKARTKEENEFPIWVWGNLLLLLLLLLCVFTVLNDFAQSSVLSQASQVSARRKGSWARNPGLAQIGLRWAKPTAESRD